jgi:hypothetical protein
MATFGLLIAMLVNVFFIQSTGFDWVISIGVVLAFSGLTAYETQMIKNMYYESDGHDVTQGDLRRLPALWRLHHHVCLDPAHPGHDARRLTRHKQTARPKARGRPRAFFFRTPVPW